MKRFDQIKFVKEILKFSPRTGKNEIRTADFLEQYLKHNNVKFTNQSFTNTIPKEKKAVLICDNQNINCRSTCFVSGKIHDKSHLISSLTSSQDFIYKSNINFNPKSKYLSSSNYYFAPSICIKTEDLDKIIKAKELHASITIEREEYLSKNILVGNLSHPENIIFAHYDSIGSGATDNASGVAVLMKIILNRSDLLQTSLFVFAGCEELSYDKPVYWGHGYREFESKYPRLLFNAEKIIIIDSVGNGATNVTNDLGLTKLAFPIKKLNQYSSKIFAVYGSFDTLMAVYHSNADDIDELSEKHLNEAYKKTLVLIL